MVAKEDATFFRFSSSWLITNHGVRSKGKTLSLARMEAVGVSGDCLWRDALRTRLGATLAQRSTV
jgi:hypothetical protein